MQGLSHHSEGRATCKCFTCIFNPSPLNHSPNGASVSYPLVALLNIPGFIERLCKLATRKVSEATGASSFLQELEDWYTWLDNALVLDALMQMASEETEQSSTGEAADCEPMTVDLKVRCLAACQSGAVATFPQQPLFELKHTYTHHLF